MHRWLRPWLAKAASAPRVFPSSGFNVIPPAQRVEEETLGWYSPKTFYPVRIGQLFQSRYQVVSKLGYGSSATVWLCRDLTYVVFLIVLYGRADLYSKGPQIRRSEGLHV